MANFTRATPRPERSGGIMGVCRGKIEPDESQRQALVRELNENWASKQPLVTMLPAISEKFRADYPSSCLACTRLPRDVTGNEHQALVWCSPEEALRYPLALLTFHY